MSTTIAERTWRAGWPGRSGGALLLLGALALGGCDGGIFGTGDGSPSVDLPNGFDSSGDNIAGTGQVGDGTQGTDGPDGSPAVPSLTFENALPTYAVASPTVRLVNASTLALALSTDPADGAGGGVSSGPVVPGASSAHVAMPDTLEPLRVSRDGGEPGTVADDTVLHDLEPLLLAPSSVTTVFTRDGGAGDGTIDAVALATRVASDDPMQALLRLVDARPDTAGGDAAASYALVPSGADPGGVEALLESVTFAVAAEWGADAGEPGAGYVPVPAGDYRLDGPDGAALLGALSLAGGEVVTLVRRADGDPLRVVDGGR